MIVPHSINTKVTSLVALTHRARPPGGAIATSLVSVTRPTLAMYETPRHGGSWHASRCARLARAGRVLVAARRHRKRPATPQQQPWRDRCLACVATEKGPYPCIATSSWHRCDVIDDARAWGAICVGFCRVSPWRRTRRQRGGTCLYTIVELDARITYYS
jgi:hypothetical protein